MDPSAYDTEAMDCSDLDSKENRNKDYLVTSSDYSSDDTSAVGIVSVDSDGIPVPDFEVELPVTT